MLASPGKCKCRRPLRRATWWIVVYFQKGTLCSRVTPHSPFGQRQLPDSHESTWRAAPHRTPADWRTFWGSTFVVVVVARRRVSKHVKCRKNTVAIIENYATKLCRRAEEFAMRRRRRRRLRRWRWWWRGRSRQRLQDVARKPKSQVKMLPNQRISAI